MAALLLGGCDVPSRGTQVTTNPPATTAASQSSSSAVPWFEDFTERSGLEFRHRTSEARPYFMPRSVGSGAAVFDFDNDGRLDCYLLQNAGPGSGATNQLFWQEE